MVDGVSEQLHTVQILSDGSFVYWLYALKSTETVPHPLNSEKLKQHPVYVQALRMEVCLRVHVHVCLSRVLEKRGRSSCSSNQCELSMQ